jgi:hypothetical protein
MEAAGCLVVIHDCREIDPPKTSSLFEGEDAMPTTTLKHQNGFSSPTLKKANTHDQQSTTNVEIVETGFSSREDQPRTKPVSELKRLECAFALVVLVVWLNLFACGMLIGSERYRMAIDPNGVQALKGTGERVQVTTGNKPGDEEVANNQTTASINPFVAWLMALLTFLPFNLALLCAASGALGAFGNRANLQDDRSALIARDRSNPYVSSLLRGFFVYLFMISGLLLIDDRPFSNASPQQYIRLAGFLSLFSFVVNYNPCIFNPLIEWAYQRMQPRGAGENAAVSYKVEKLSKTTERESTHETVATGEVTAASREERTPEYSQPKRLQPLREEG